MIRTPNQDKALKWYIDTNNLRVQLSAHPIYFFLDSKGNEQKRNIINIHMNWEEWHKNEKKRKIA